ncbi:MAG TPA: hypothetical protein V6C76_17220 [Drouetiella sp.]
MFKSRLNQFFRQFRRTKQEPVVEEPVCPDLQARLQHLSERFPDVEQPAEDVPQVTVYDVDLTDDADLLEHERLREEEKLSLNHWATKRRRNDATGSSSEVPTNPSNLKQSFEYAVDPVRAALKITESIEKQNKELIQSPFPNVINTPEYQSVSGSSFNSLPSIGTDSLSDVGLHSLSSSDRHSLLEPDTQVRRSTNEQSIAQRALEAHIRKSKQPDTQKTAIDEINEVRVQQPEIQRSKETPRSTKEKLQALETMHAMAKTRTQELLQQAREKSRAQEILQTPDDTGVHKLPHAPGRSRANASNQKLPPVPVTVENRKTVGPAISEAAVRSMLLHQSKKIIIVRSLDDKIEDTALAEQWDCLSSNSLFALPDESVSYENTAEYEEDYEEDLLPYFTETLLAQEDDLGQTRSYDQLDSPFMVQKQPADGKLSSNQGENKSARSGESKTAAPAGSNNDLQLTGTESSTTLQPYKNFSENALKLIAQKPETPAVTLKWLASHSNPHIRAAVAKNPSTPADTITVLAKDHEAGIRHSIAENVLSSMDALNLLIKDRNPLIAWRAKNTVSVLKEQQRAAQQAKEAALQEAQKENHFAVREAKIASVEETIAFLQVIARKTNTPARRLDELARHTDARVRAAVAENANAPADILWLLSRDPDSTVKTKVTDNYNCPIEILEAMKEDEDAYVAYQAHSQLNRVLGSTFTDVHVRTATWP